MKINVRGSIPVVFFKEDNSFIAHCPVLELSTCGATFDEAAAAFDEVLNIFFEECAERGTLDEVLQSCGWKIKKTNSQRNITPPLFVGQRQVSLSIPPLEECPA
ncbi:MAG: type II toxin-antitoxin system HicB family antitoxin [Limisphaerales bacterium]